MTQHTQGKWRVYTGHDNHFIHQPYILADNPDKNAPPIDICQMHLSGKPENMANARLIAAAPEMLEVLREITRRGIFTPSTHEKASRAIAKAEGTALLYS